MNENIVFYDIQLIGVFNHIKYWYWYWLCKTTFRQFLVDVVNVGYCGRYRCALPVFRFFNNMTLYVYQNILLLHSHETALIYNCSLQNVHKHTQCKRVVDAGSVIFLQCLFFGMNFCCERYMDGEIGTTSEFI